MQKFKGKKLLILGSNVGSVDIVKYARKNGAITYVSDNLSVEKSQAKHFCDFPIFLSTADTESLKLLIKNEHIDAVFAGISEFNLVQAMTLSEHLGLRYYCNSHQWKLIENKDQFRKLCFNFGVPHPETYFMGKPLSKSKFEEEIPIPCIIKPTDGSASCGVTICKSKDSIPHAIDEATRNSSTHQIIAEEFIEGEEFSAHYNIVGGIATLSTIDNRFPVKLHQGDVTTVPIARVYPSTFLNEYVRLVNPQMIKLCESLQIDTGIIFVQGIYNRQLNRFCIFEAGLRSAGEAPCRLTEKVNGVNGLKAMVDYLLIGKSPDYYRENEDPTMKGHSCCILSFVTKGGKVCSINGMEETLKNVPSIIDSECRYPVGSTTPKGDTLRQIMLRFVLDCLSKGELARDIDYINSHIDVRNINDEPLCITFDSSRLFS